jgi:hypothetical protein
MLLACATQGFSQAPKGLPEGVLRDSAVVLFEGYRGVWEQGVMLDIDKGAFPCLLVPRDSGRLTLLRSQTPESIVPAVAYQYVIQNLRVGSTHSSTLIYGPDTLTFKGLHLTRATRLNELLSAYGALYDYSTKRRQGFLIYENMH